MNKLRRKWINETGAMIAAISPKSSILVSRSSPLSACASLPLALFGSISAPVSASASASEKNPLLPTQSTADYAAVLPSTGVQFPRDFGSHPDFRTEWWYVSGWLDVETGERSQNPKQHAMGFQITFFRTRTALRSSNASQFTPRQLMFAHIALAQPQTRTLLHDQQSARTGFGLAQASETDTNVSMKRWQLLRSANDVYTARCTSGLLGNNNSFALELTLTPSGPPQLQGEAGFSRKGPNLAQASHYYSRPQLAVQGGLTVNGKSQNVTGRAWLDHEWSSSLLDPQATGWDWIGINLIEGGSLLAFRLRDAAGNNIWTHVARRDASGQFVFKTNQANGAQFTGLRTWQSIASGARYPVKQKLQFDGQTFEIDPLFDEQEIDGRLSTGGFYWEGAVYLRDQNQQIVGRGYLEMTGYASPIKF